MKNWLFLSIALLPLPHILSSSADSPHSLYQPTGSINTPFGTVEVVDFTQVELNRMATQGKAFDRILKRQKGLECGLMSVLNAENIYKLAEGKVSKKEFEKAMQNVNTELSFARQNIRQCPIDQDQIKELLSNEVPSNKFFALPSIQVYEPLNLTNISMLDFDTEHDSEKLISLEKSILHVLENMHNPNIKNDTYVFVIGSMPSIKQQEEMFSLIGSDKSINEYRTLIESDIYRMSHADRATITTIFENTSALEDKKEKQEMLKLLPTLFPYRFLSYSDFVSISGVGHWIVAVLHKENGNITLYVANSANDSADKRKMENKVKHNNLFIENLRKNILSLNANQLEHDIELIRDNALLYDDITQLSENVGLIKQQKKERIAAEQEEQRRLERERLAKQEEERKTQAEKEETVRLKANQEFKEHREREREKRELQARLRKEVQRRRREADEAALLAQRKDEQKKVANQLLSEQIAQEEKPLQQILEELQVSLPIPEVVTLGLNQHTDYTKGVAPSTLEAYSSTIITLIIVALITSSTLIHMQKKQIEAHYQRYREQTAR